MAGRFCDYLTSAVDKLFGVTIRREHYWDTPDFGRFAPLVCEHLTNNDDDEAAHATQIY